MARTFLHYILKIHNLVSFRNLNVTIRRTLFIRQLVGAFMALVLSSLYPIRQYTSRMVDYFQGVYKLYL